MQTWSFHFPQDLNSFWHKVWWFDNWISFRFTSHFADNKWKLKDGTFHRFFPVFGLAETQKVRDHTCFCTNIMHIYMENNINIRKTSYISKWCSWFIREPKKFTGTQSIRILLTNSFLEMIPWHPIFWPTCHNNSCADFARDLLLQTCLGSGLKWLLHSAVWKRDWLIKKYMHP